MTQPVIPFNNQCIKNIKITGVMEIRSDDEKRIKGTIKRYSTSL